eukprot:scaffold13285_cov36-Cyclotella_meneghiniana.AAC.3
MALANFPISGPEKAIGDKERRRGNQGMKIRSAPMGNFKCVGPTSGMFSSIACANVRTSTWAACKVVLGMPGRMWISEKQRNTGVI